MFREIRSALRGLRRELVSSAAAAAVLALGLGLGATVFATVRSVILEPPPVEEPGRLVSVFASGTSGVSEYEPIAYPDVRELREGVRSLASLTAYAPTTVALQVDSGPGFGAAAEVVDRNYFETLGIALVRGRSLLGTEAGSSGGCGVAVLSEELSRRLGPEPHLRVNGLPVAVVGIARQGFRGLMRGLDTQLWLPIDCVRELRFEDARNVRLGQRNANLGFLDDPGLRWVWAVGRLREGVPLEGAAREVAEIGARRSAERPPPHAERRFLTAPTEHLRVAPDVDRRLRAAGAGALVLAFFVLLAVTGNLAALVLMRSVGRRREIATRRALGAGICHILGVLWLDAALLAAPGTLGALAVMAMTAEAVRRSVRFLPVPIELGVALDGATVAFTASAALVSTLLLVSLPALDLLHSMPARSLRSGATATEGRGTRRLLELFVVVQLTISLAASVVAATAATGFRQATRIDPGLRPDGMVTARLDLGLQGFDEVERRRVHERLLREVRDLPGVAEASYASHLPLSMELLLARVSSAPSANPDDAVEADWAAIDIGYFETTGALLLAGRGFELRERTGEDGVVVVNRELARRLWPDLASPADALGRRVWTSDGTGSLRVVGVAAVGRYRGLGEPPRPFLYRLLPLDAKGARLLVVRLRSDAPGPDRAFADLRRVLGGLEPRPVVLGLRTAREVLAPAWFVPRTAAGALASFAGLALVVAAIGLFGTLGHSVGRRRREIGIRIAVGGSPARVAAGILLDWLPWLGLAVVLAVPTGVLAARRLTALVPVTGPWEARSVAVAGGLLVATCALAVLGPARRAAAVEPARVLRED